MIIPAIINKPFEQRTDMIYPANIYVSEMFLLINEPDLKFPYEISNWGRVRRLLPNGEYRYLGIFVDTKGYPYTDLVHNDGRKHHRIHRLIMQTFYPIENPQDYQVNHIDSIRCNPFVGNLEWCTPSDNIQHALKYGNGVVGEKAQSARFTEEQVHQVCQILQETQANITYREILERMGMEFNSNNQSILSTIRLRQNWVHISKDYDFPEPMKIHSDEEIHFICQCIVNGMTNPEVFQALGLTDKSLYGRYCDIFHKIRSKSAYQDIVSQYNIPEYNPKQKFDYTDEMIHEICRRISNDEKYRDIYYNMGFEQMGLKLNTFKSMYGRLRRREVRYEITSQYQW